jgi:hypothetical protein
MQLYMLCAAILTLKMLLTGTAVGTLRVAKGVFIAVADDSLRGGEPRARRDRDPTALESDPTSAARFVVLRSGTELGE